jgi:hypothetical protein
MPISVKLGANHPWVKEIVNCANKRPGPLQREDNLKMGWAHLKSSSPEPLSQKSSNLHKSSLIYCGFKFVQIMVPGGWEGPQ